MEVFILLLIALFLLLTLIAMCKILAKADIPWGFLFIPVYGIYCTYKVADCTGIFWANLILGVASSIIGVPAVTGIIGIILVILNFVYYKCLAEAFGKGTGFAIGLFLLGPIFIWILGFGDAEHQATVSANSYVRRAQDWKCPDCSTANGCYRATCKNCGFVKPVLYASNMTASTSTTSKTTSIKDTWMCPDCETRNPKTSFSCKNCGRGK